MLFRNAETEMVAISEVFERYYVMQPNTWNMSTPVYVTEDPPHFYIRYQPISMQWEVRDGMIDSSELYAYMPRSEPISPQHLNQSGRSWRGFVTGTDVAIPGASLECTGKTQ